MWTAPFSQDIGSNHDQIACVHMSGLLMQSHMTAGQDGFRDVSSEQRSGLLRPWFCPELPASRIDRSHHLLPVLQESSSAQHGRSVLLP